MHSNFIPALAGAVLLSVAAMPANAADIIYDPPVYKYEPPVPVPVSHGGWYLRGYVGLTNQRYRGLDSNSIQDVVNFPGSDFTWVDRGRFGSSGLIGGGVGYEINQWLRGDVTVEYRHDSRFSALDRWNRGGDPADPVTNHYTARKSELLFLANAYADLGTYYGMTPYVGAGIGTSRNTISGFRDYAPNDDIVNTAANHSQWQLAWALHAGLGVDLTDQATLDIGYSFTHLGNGRTGAVTPADPDFPNDPFVFRNLYSHDIKVGLRYRFN
ncbi:outer membrane beta-barrel protein [Chelativorans sp. ZYF759]|uniref:outer membrane protein n=1 Tax=Chelativorans sp. ZYF759 TaxID=2692213 RepID=UPI00145E1D0B|nr:outer membrane beta-barrel protein [Chelativorans sp. ZYF759]NMG37991.1 outer membrane beta-barrel protein [Chelativorans sp. ZYF759]